MCTHCIEDPALLHLNILQDQFAYDQDLELPFIQYLLYIYTVTVQDMDLDIEQKASA